MRRASLLLLASLIVGCGDKPTVTPIGPSPSDPPVAAAPVPAGFTLSGVITVSGSGGDPCTGSRVSVDTGTGVRFTHAGPDGRYIVRGLPAGLVRITVSWDGFETVERTMQISQDTVMNFELRAQG